jgi:hypothetical protein
MATLDRPDIASSNPSRPLPSGVARLRRRRRHENRFRPKARWLILALFAVFSAGIVLSGNGRDFLRYLYSPVAIIVVIFAIAEYIVLKGRDRSRIYRLELDQMREKRHQEIDFLHEMEDELRETERALEALGDGGDSAAEAGKVRARLAALRERLSHRL